jgi:iron(II)-dependent oxidoreductase
MTTMSEFTDDLKQVVADELDRVRRRSLGLTVHVLDDDELVAQHSRLMSPLVWDLAHVGNYEELWLLRAAAGIEPMRPEIDTLYDAFEHPRAVRPTLPLLTPAESTRYIDQVRRKVLDSLDTVRLDDGKQLTDGGFVYGMVLQHEHQHDETMLATHQLRRGDVVLSEHDAPPVPWTPVETQEVLVPGGPFVMGTSSDPWAYDNERPAHRVEVDPFWIDTTPVSNGAFLSFVEDGGYDEPGWWSAEGWQWRTRSGKRGPAFWHRDAGTWLTRRFGVILRLDLDEAVEHVCFYEAEAFARWAGRRLPTEPEWEKAASWDPDTQSKRRYPWGDDPPDPGLANLGQARFRPTRAGSYPAGASAYGARQMLGDVWEWTSTDFRGHPGFCTFPYREYSEVFFGADYKVLRGGSWATDPLACRTTFRNWDYPVRRQIFAGFRTARSA